MPIKNTKNLIMNTRSDSFLKKRRPKGDEYDRLISDDDDTNEQVTCQDRSTKPANTDVTANNSK